MEQFKQAKNFLAAIIAQAEQNSADARKLAAELSEQQMNWRASPEQWSIAECLEHLAMSNEGFSPYFSAVIARGRAKSRTNSAPAYQPSFMGGLLIKQVMPEAPRKLKAPKVFRPAEALVITGALDHFLRTQNQFLAFVRETDGLDYNKIRLRSPVTPLIRYSLADAFVVTAVHGQRHLGQARRVLESPQFPRSLTAAAK